MPLSYLARPLVLLVVLYMVGLAVLRHLGRFGPQPPGEEAWLRFRHKVEVEGAAVSPLTENRLGERVFVDAELAGGKPFPRKVLAFLPKAGPLNHSIRPGMRLRLEGKLRLPRRPRNPGEFDEKGFLADRGVGWIMRVRRVFIVSSEVPWVWRLKAWAESSRRAVQDRFQRFLGTEEAMVMTGVCLGYKGPLSRETNRAIQDAGVMHLLVPSGAKVAFVLLCAEWLGRRLLSPVPRFAAVAAVGGFYTLMVGADAPYSRAFLAWTFFRAAGLLGREPGTFHAMVLSALALLVLRPRDLFSAGFQMTYLAVFGLLLAMPRVNDALPPRWPRWLRSLVQVLAVSVIVQVMLWPTFAAYFGRGALVGVLANILLVPASGLMMAMGFGLALAGGGPGGSLALAAGAVVRLFIRTCLWFASFPSAAVDLSPMSWRGVAVYYLLLLGVLVVPRWRASAALLSCGVLVWGGAALAGMVRPVTVVRFLCLPKGRAALVSFPDGKDWLVDAGGPAGTILRACKARKVRGLDRVVITSMGEERWRGLQHVLDGLRVRSVTVPSETAPPRLAAILAGARAAGVSVAQDPSAGRFRLLRGKICFDFSKELPSVRRGEAEYSIIGPRLRWRSIEVTTDGEKAEITDQF